MTDDGHPRIAVLGAGHSGPVVARIAVEAGFNVSIAASGEPAKIALIARVLAPGAEPRWAAEAVADADVVILAIPIHRFAAFDPALVAGKIVVDIMNYWPPVDGRQEMFEDRDLGTSEIVQRRLVESSGAHHNPIAALEALPTAARPCAGRTHACRGRRARGSPGRARATRRVCS